MSQPPTAPNRRLLLACLVEASLALVAAALAWGFGVPLRELAWPVGRVASATLLGAVATLPMLAFLWWMMRTGWRPMAGLRQQAEKLVGRLLDGATPGPTIALAVAAGVGEELLFRGAIQPIVAGWTSPWAAVLIVAVLFGLVHPISRMYVAAATLAGLYLGALAAWSGEVLSAVVAHSLYDVAALVWFRTAAGQGDKSVTSL